MPALYRARTCMPVSHNVIITVVLYR